MSDTITFTLDGAEVQAAPGLSIWEVANSRGIVIPHLCHKPAPGYRPDGNCRACMVEIDGERTLAASCIRAPAEGMVVTTGSPRAKAARTMVIIPLWTLRRALVSAPRYFSLPRNSAPPPLASSSDAATPPPASWSVIARFAD